MEHDAVDNTMKRKTITILLFAVLIFISSIKSNAQQFIAAEAFVKDNKVYLRCVPNNNNTLNDIKEKGVTIKRIPWEQSSLPDTSDFKSATAVFYIAPLAANDTNWIQYIKTKEAAGFLYNLLYKPSNNKAEGIDMVFGLAMLSCNFDVELAKAVGLFYTEEKLPKAKYAYLIQPTEKKLTAKIKPAILLVNSAINNQLKNIDTLKIEARRKNITLSWNEERLQNDYTGYFIERSGDGKKFTQLNQQPHIQVQSQYEENKKYIYYNDTLPEYGKPYYYRVRGLSMFGFSGNYSNVVKCTGIKPLIVFPQMDSTRLLNDSILQIHWHLPKGFNTDELKGFDVYRSKKSDIGFVKLNKKLLPENTNTYTDLNPNKLNYYKVLAYNTAGDSAYSYPLMGIVPDKTPPVIPLGFKGKVDTSGRVLLMWKPNHEKDLKGYRIFRNNDVNEERVEITKYIITDTIFKDSITLETLTEDVYYFITAVDEVYNNSSYSPAIKLKRPDKIKPVAALFKEVIHSDTTIVVKWINSTSKDAERYELWRNYGNKPLEKIKEWKASDSLSEFIDTPLEYAVYYQYQLKVVDDDGNFSMSTSAVHYFDARVRKPIKKITYIINRENNTITLRWEYPEKDLYSFAIYKAKKGEPLKIIKTVKGNVFSYEDKELSVGNEYEYYIKANFNSGAESYISVPLKIGF